MTVQAFEQTVSLPHVCGMKVESTFIAFAKQGAEAAPRGSADEKVGSGVPSPGGDTID